MAAGAVGAAGAAFELGAAQPGSVFAAHDGSSDFAQPHDGSAGAAHDGSEAAAQVPDAQLEQVPLEQELQLELDSLEQELQLDEQP